MAAPISPLTPERFYTEVKKAGFELGADDQTGAPSLTITRLLFPVHQGSAPATTAVGEDLLCAVPRLAGQPLRAIHNNHYTIGESRSKHMVVWLRLFQVEPSFHAALGKLVRIDEELTARQAALDTLFDTKLEEEVEQDPEVARLRETYQGADQNLAPLSDALNSRRAKVRVELEKLRGTFRYVADERDL